MMNSTAKQTIGVDCDGTLTAEKSYSVLSMTPAEVEHHIKSCTPKKGIEVLLQSPLDIIINTGRQERYRELTADWMKDYGIP